MPTNLFAIQPRRVNFRTQTNADWLDGLVIWQAGAGGIVAGAANAGNGALTVNSVAPRTSIGHHVMTVTSLDGIPRITVQGPDGTATATGVAGLPIYAAGLSLTLSPGSAAFAVGDTFAVEVLQVPVDITGLTFALHARLTALSANVALAAYSAPPDGAAPSIVTGTTGGQISLHVLRAALTRSVFPPNSYVHDILATDPVAGLTVPAFFGTIEHLDGVTHLP